ncbi:hypothetical protein GCM10009738_21930 [Kitasatospora viridis]
MLCFTRIGSTFCEVVSEPSGFATVNDVSVVNASTVTGLPVFFACAWAIWVGPGATCAVGGLAVGSAGPIGAASAGRAEPASAVVNAVVNAAASASRRRSVRVVVEGLERGTYDFLRFKGPRGVGAMRVEKPR